MEAQCKDGVRDDGVGERRGSLGVGFENMFLGHEMRGPEGTGRGGVSMAGGREDQSARKGNGVKRLKQVGAEMV